jgi:hypothetical protein
MLPTARHPKVQRAVSTRARQAGEAMVEKRSWHICLVADDANVTSPKRGPEAPRAYHD